MRSGRVTRYSESGLDLGAARDRSWEVERHLDENAQTVHVPLALFQKSGLTEDDDHLCERRF